MRTADRPERLANARTLADLEAAETIESKHVAEAIQYRNLDHQV